MTAPIRIRATDRSGNIAYIHRDAGGIFKCMLPNGVSASFFYAGIWPDEMACRFALNDCATGDDALAIVRRYGSDLQTYELLPTETGSPQLGLLARSLTALFDLEAELQRLKSLLPGLTEHLDGNIVARARAVLAGTDMPETGTLYAELPTAPGLYLRLYHGRRDPAQDMDDWGSEGPVIGPLAYVQTTYMCDVKFGARPEIMDRFFPEVMNDWREKGFSNAAGPLCDWDFAIVDDLIQHDGVFYGDWTVFHVDGDAGSPARSATIEP